MPNGRPQERFDALYDATYPDVVRFLRRRMTTDDAEDIAHDTFLVVWRRRDEIPRRTGEDRAWVFGVARNCLLGALRRQGRDTALGVRIGEAALIGGTADGDDVAGLLDLTQAWGRLPPDQQEVLALTAWENLSSAEAGLVLGISSAAYRMRLARARSSLRTALDTPAQLDAPRRR